MGKQRCYEVCPEYFEGERCSYCDMEELRDWMENHPDEVYKLTGASDGWWLGAMFDRSEYNREEYKISLDRVLGANYDYAVMNLQEATAYKQNLIEQMRRACRDDQRGLKAVKSKKTTKTV